MSDKPKCSAQRCSLTASHDFRGTLLCGTHYNQLVRRGRVILKDGVLRLEGDA